MMSGYVAEVLTVLIFPIFIFMVSKTDNYGRLEKKYLTKIESYKEIVDRRRELMIQKSFNAIHDQKKI